MTKKWKKLKSALTFLGNQLLHLIHFKEDVRFCLLLIFIWKLFKISKEFKTLSVINYLAGFKMSKRINFRLWINLLVIFIKHTITSNSAFSKIRKSQIWGWIFFHPNWVNLIYLQFFLPDIAGTSQINKKTNKIKFLITLQENLCQTLAPYIAMRLRFIYYRFLFSLSPRNFFLNIFGEV